MPSRREVGVVVVAAGRGERAGGGAPKQFRPIGGVPMLLRALRPFLKHPGVGPVVAVVPADAAAAPPEWLGGLIGERLRLAAGGAERMDSVAAGVAALDDAVRLVLIHDAARPFVDEGIIDAVLAEAAAGRAAIAAIPVADTLKEARPGSGVVGRTVSREGLWRAQTPQAFPVALLREALAAARSGGTTMTDEAAAVEAVGAEVVLVRDRSTNFKVTTPDDFLLAEALAGRVP